MDPGFQDAHYNLAWAYHANAQYEDAVNFYRLAIKLDARDSDAHYNLAEIYRETGQFDSSIREYEKALAFGPDDPEIYYQLARVYQKKGDNLKLQKYLNIFLKHTVGMTEFENEIQIAKQMREALAADDADSQVK